MPVLIDTNILVYRFDPRFPDKQSKATRLLREGIAHGDIRLPHQAIVEFVAATTRLIDRETRASLLTPEEARREAEELMSEIPVLYPVDEVLRLALRGWATYQFSWFDAQLWAYAEHFGMGTIYSEDFQDGRVYGTVRIVNPFLS